MNKENDSEDSEEDDFHDIDRKINVSKFTIYPDSRFKSIWDLLTFFILFYLCFMIPYRFAFETESEVLD